MVRVGIVLNVCAALCVGALCALADDRRPDTGILQGQKFLPVFDGICGLGKVTSQGCEAIKARDIVDAA